MPKLLGREPALTIGAINSLIMLAGTLGFTLLSAEQAGLWVLLVNAVSAAIVAWATRPLSPAVFSYLLATIVAVGGAYGLEFSAEFVNGLNMALVPILMFLTRGQVSPVETAVTKPSANPVPEAGGGTVDEPVGEEAISA
jgi:hypothetical protein